MGLAAANRIKELVAPDPIPVSYPQLLQETGRAIAAVVMEKMVLFGSVDRAR